MSEHAPIDSEWEVDAPSVKEQLDRGDDLLLLDCRTDQEVTIATIAGSLHIPMHELTHRMEELRVHEDRPVVVYCHHGRRSLMVTASLRQAGFENVRSMAGGIDDWSRRIDASVPQY